MPFIAPWGKTTCPFCFHRFRLPQANRRNTRPAGDKEKDERVGAFLSMPAPELGCVTPPEERGFLSRAMENFYVNGASNGDLKKVCPQCHMFLPYAAASGQLTSKVVAIIGARSSGKSNYFGVLLHSLEHRYADELDFTIYDQETFSVTEMKPVGSKRLYRERYGKRLFNTDDRMAIDQNRSAQQDRDLRIPLIYRLEFQKRPIHYFTQPFSRVTAMDLVIFDAAGEDMEDPTAFDQFCRYILGAAGIIFIIDPFQFPGVRSQLDDGLRDRFGKIEVGPTEIVSRVISMFENRMGLGVGRKIPVPVAFAFSKSDALKGIVHPSSTLLRDSRHEGGFNADDCERTSEEVIECVREWDGPGLVNLARSKFRSYSFFALSALGQLPDEQLRIRPVSPLRVADPLLWLLWKRGYLPTMK